MACSPCLSRPGGAGRGPLGTENQPLCNTERAAKKAVTSPLSFSASQCLVVCSTTNRCFMKGC